MQIETSIKIVSKRDYCHLTRTASGGVQIGQINLDSDEAKEFPTILAQGLVELEKLSPIAPPTAS